VPSKIKGSVVSARKNLDFLRQIIGEPLALQAIWFHKPAGLARPHFKKRPNS
jgi:hypothetical protein